MQIWICPPDWPGSTVYIVAGGPSVAGQNIAALKGRKVIAVNSSCFRVPFADFLVFGDSRWWFEHRPRLKDFAGRIVSMSQSVKEPPILRMIKRDAIPFAEKRTDLAMRRTTLQAAINLAAHLGAVRVVLLGADMQPGEDGRTHHHEPHRWPVVKGCWDEQMAELRLMAKPLKRRGIEVINASPRSRIDWWPYKPLEECLSWQT